MENEKRLLKMVLAGVVALIGLIVGTSSLFTVGPGEKAIVLRFGEIVREADSGLHMKWPFPIEQIVKVETRIQKYETDAVAYSKDIQTVQSKVALNFHLNPSTVQVLWKELGRDYLARIVEPAIQESMKAVSSGFTAQELIEQRPKVKENVVKALSERLSAKNIIVDDFSIVNFDFSNSYEKAIEEKQVAQQDALKAKNKLEQVKFEAEQRITQAKAEAEAIRIQAQAITQQGGSDYVQLKAIERWKGDVPQYMMGNSVPFINLK